VPSEFRIRSAGATAEAGLIAGWIR
jgi:hypothetical protein